MSKEIDFSKAPEGATHYREANNNVDWYRKIDNEWQYWRASSNSWSYGADWFYSALPIPHQWSIYTNDKPLCELTDEQVGKLVKHSGYVEHMNPNSGKWVVTISPMWNRYGVYRIKQKSERELFVDAAMQLITSETERTLEQQFGALFDSGKFELVEQPK